MASQLHAAIGALVTAWGAAASLNTVTVHDGPQASSDAGDEFLFVGDDAAGPDEQNDVATGEQDWAQLGKLRREENGFITCAVVVRSGTADVAAARARALDVVSDCEDVLRAEPTLGGLVLWCEISEYRYIPTITTAGAKARVVFTVKFKARI